VDEAAGGRRTWFVEVFLEYAQVSSFLNSVGLDPSQLVALEFASVGPNAYRILLLCQLTDQQDALRREWQAVEDTLRSRKQETPAGSAH